MNYFVNSACMPILFFVECIYMLLICYFQCYMVDALALAGLMVHIVEADPVRICEFQEMAIFAILLKILAFLWRLYFSFWLLHGIHVLFTFLMRWITLHYQGTEHSMQAWPFSNLRICYIG